MGFMDKAKKMAEQAQSKLDEVQKQFNEGQAGGSQQSQGLPVEYDKHGRPIRSEAPPDAAPPPTPPTDPQPAAPPTESTSPPHGDPLSHEPAEEEDRNNPSYAPPKLSSGDPLL
jgi:hypothetical protein